MPLALGAALGGRVERRDGRGGTGAARQGAEQQAADHGGGDSPGSHVAHATPARHGQARARAEEGALTPRRFLRFRAASGTIAPCGKSRFPSSGGRPTGRASRSWSACPTTARCRSLTSPATTTPSPGSRHSPTASPTPSRAICTTTCTSMGPPCWPRRSPASSWTSTGAATTSSTTRARCARAGGWCAPTPCAMCPSLRARWDWPTSRRDCRRSMIPTTRLWRACSASFAGLPGMRCCSTATPGVRAG